MSDLFLIFHLFLGENDIVSCCCFLAFTQLCLPFLLKRRKDFVCHFSGNNTATLIFSTTDSSKHLLALRSIPVFPIQVGINTTFIHIRNLFRRYILDFLLIGRYFFWILLLVAGCLFFRVILCRFSA